MATNNLENAKQVLSTEIIGIEALIAELGKPGTILAEAFERAVETCLKVTGRVIVTGMGKSGHIGRKIAATLASTGTPSLFVHPAEASHGDLGMISESDVVLALSNSGETRELGDILGYCSRFNIPLMGMTSGPASSLAKASDMLLLVPKSNEACGITKAPTTSTTQMLALGDALCVALLRAKGFSATDFHTFHPGGKLGSALKRVTDLMHHTELPLCSPDADIESILKGISQAGFGCIGVTDPAGALIGIITDGDLRRHFTASVTQTSSKAITAADIMTKSPRTFPSDGLAAEALSILSKTRITALFIIDQDNRPIGLLHVHDCLSEGVA